MLTEALQDPRLRALSAARGALYGVQAKTGPLSDHVRLAIRAMVAADDAASVSHESTAADLRRAVRFEGSLRQQVGFIDRPDEEIRRFLDLVAKGLEAVQHGASTDATAVAASLGDPSHEESAA